MPDRIDQLVSILLDPNARDDERDDAAIALGNFSEQKALDALLRVGTDPGLQDAFFIDVCGESIAKILVNKGEKALFNEALIRLTPLAKHAAYKFTKAERPEWLT